MRLFFIAMQFLTIIPIPCANEWQEREMGRSMRWFPLAGLAIGALLAGLDRLLSGFLPSQLTALLLVTALAIITGALHLDGVADVCDGLGARGGRERFLAVMKDSATGAIGVVGVVLVLLLKYQALLCLPDRLRTGAIILFPAAARFSQVLLTAGARRARSDGLGAAFASGAGSLEMVIAAATVVASAWLLLGPPGIVCTAVAAVTALLARTYFERRLGGITGDIVGATSEVAEILCLLTVVALRGT
jgi:adenosylcobinamide-GDP ribazoletransferase